MKIAELKKRDDFANLVEYAHRMADAYDVYSYYLVKFENSIDLDERPMALARRLDKIYVEVSE